MASRESIPAQSSAAANVGAYARLVANGPNQPSATLVLLTGDSADIVTYYADLPGRLEYAFGEHTFAFPKVGELLADQKTLVGPASIRLVAPTGIKNVAILEVKRANGRDPAKLEGAPAPPAEGEAPVATAPAIVSVPATRSVARGGTTTLFVSASGENLSYQWKKNGQAIPGATSPALPLENATGADAGSYVVQVTNADGNATMPLKKKLLGLGVDVDQLDAVGPGDIERVAERVLSGSAPSVAALGPIDDIEATSLLAGRFGG